MEAPVKIIPLEMRNLKYKFLPPLGYAPECVARYGETTQGVFVKECKLFLDFEQNLTEEELLFMAQNADQRAVKPNKSNVYTSFEKCDVEKISPNDELEKYIDKLMEEYFEPFLTADISTEHEYARPTSCGKTFKARFKCKNKGEALDHPEFINYVFDIDHIPLWSIAPKLEILPLSDILPIKDGGRNKIRTIFIPDIQLLAKQKLFFDNQNQNIIDRCTEFDSWIAYGFTKQYMGFHSLGKEFEGYGFVNEGDCSGYDRVADLEKVYTLRKKFLNCPADLKPMLEHTIRHTVNPYVICPDGVIRQRLTGNCSGSNNTCVDNSILHVRINFRWICKVFYKDFGYYPSLQEILLHNHARIYSDDALTAWKMDKYLSTPKEILELKFETYAEYQMVCKPSQEFSSNSLERLDPQHSFLGSSFHFEENLNVYIPFPRINKLCSSLRYLVEDKPVQDIFCKAIMLSILASPHPVLFSICSKFTKYMAKQMYDRKFEIPQAFKDIIATIECDSCCFYNFILGRESKLPLYLEIAISDGAFKMNANSEIKVKRGERIMNSLGNKVGLTPEAKAWLTIALDPFHDGQIPNLEGYPDTQTSPSVVQVVKKSMNIVKPSGLAAGNWDLMIHFHDSLSTNLAKPCGLNENILIQNTSAWDNQTPTMHAGGISIVARLSSNTDHPLWMFSGDNSRGTALTSPSTDPEFLKGRVRCIARGFEIRNTTAEIYKQGSIAVYRQPTAPEEFATYNSKVTISNPSSITPEVKKTKKVDLPLVNVQCTGARSLRFSTPPPDNLEDALLLPGTRQWEAKHGCYVVQTQYDMENSASYHAPQGTLINLDETGLPFPSVIVSEASQTMYTQIPNGSDNVVIYDGGEEISIHIPTYASQKFIPFNPCGTILSGLSDNSTITLNWIEVFERTISSEQKDLVTLAKPSAPVNFQALELYSAVWRELPVGVPVEENGLGEWFLGVCDTIADTVSSIARPILGAIGGYQQTRNQITPKPPQPQPTNSWTQPEKVHQKPPKQQAGKAKISKKGKVKVTQGPQLPNGKFKGKNANR